MKRNVWLNTWFIVAWSFFAFVLPAPAATVQAKLQSPNSRTAAPPFRLTDAYGRTRQMADYRGRVVLLNFWATDCGGCRLEIPWFVELNETFKNTSVAVVGVSMDISYEGLKNAAEGWARVKPFVEAHQIKYSILMGDDGLTKAYDLRALPASYLIDRHGRIAATYVGLIDKVNVEANIRSLLHESR